MPRKSRQNRRLTNLGLQKSSAGSQVKEAIDDIVDRIIADEHFQQLISDDYLPYSDGSDIEPDPFGSDFEEESYEDQLSGLPPLESLNDLSLMIEAAHQPNAFKPQGRPAFYSKNSTRTHERKIAACKKKKKLVAGKYTYM